MKILTAMVVAGSTALYTTYNVYTVYTVLTVYTVFTVYTVYILYTRIGHSDLINWDSIRFIQIILKTLLLAHLVPWWWLVAC